MSQLILSLSTWLHDLATIVFIGHHLLLALFYLPAIAAVDGGGAALSVISKRSRLWMYLSLLVFLVTGTYLTLVDPNYLGLGNFGNAWGVLMLVKHLVILVMVGLGLWFNAFMRVGPRMSANTGVQQAIASFRSYTRWMAICGVVVLLLTALAQFQ